MAGTLTSCWAALLLLVGVAAQATSGVTDGEISANWNSIVVDCWSCMLLDLCVTLHIGGELPGLNLALHMLY